MGGLKLSEIIYGPSAPIKAIFSDYEGGDPFTSIVFGNDPIYEALFPKMPDPVTLPTVDQVVDKTTPQAADQLGAPGAAEDESTKRKRKGAKSKFKIEKDSQAEPTTTGVTVGGDTTGKTVGVQI